MMFDVKTVDTGIEGLGTELTRETVKDGFSLVARAAERLVARAREKLGVRRGPSRPGTPPAKELGDLQAAVGRTGPFPEPQTSPHTATVAWGVGVGDEAEGRIDDWAARSGRPRSEMFQRANLHENGGVGADGRRYPPRPFIRTTEAELESSIAADWDGEL